MFVQQAARQFEIWTGKPALAGDMLRAVTITLQERAAAHKPKARSANTDAGPALY
jgi:3-dehydroquinate dehydratase/shikimate dehydrogenase